MAISELILASFSTKVGEELSCSISVEGHSGPAPCRLAAAEYTTLHLAEPGPIQKRYSVLIPPTIIELFSTAAVSDI